MKLDWEPKPNCVSKQLSYFKKTINDSSLKENTTKSELLLYLSKDTSYPRNSKYKLKFLIIL